MSKNNTLSSARSGADETIDAMMGTAADVQMDEATDSTPAETADAMMDTAADVQMDEATDSTPAETADETTSELIELLRQRDATYVLLSRLYSKEVDQALLDELHGMLYPVETGDDNADRGYLYIATYLSNLWSDSVSELKVDFARCFFGHGVDSYAAAYPYESVYTSPKRLMMQEARDEVLKTYRRWGLEKTSEWKEGEDHLSLELEFEHILGQRTIEALTQNDEHTATKLLIAQRCFLEDHLVSWVPMMTADMKKFSHTKLYIGLAHLTDGFLAIDNAFLDDVLRDID